MINISGCMIYSRLKGKRFHWNYRKVKFIIHLHVKSIRQSQSFSQLSFDWTAKYFVEILQADFSFPAKVLASLQMFREKAEIRAQILFCNGVLF